ncbi:hypothetical protein QQ045_011102 [Rhodiola kirilowii]
MAEDKKLWTLIALATPISPLPVKYLGVNLSDKSLRAAECSSLVAKMTNMIHHWSSRLLSRAGRLVLVKSVLQSIVLYWPRIFLFPKKVIKAVNSICANFLWNGCSSRRGCHLVNWDEVCRPKSEGGLGVKDLQTMNEALVLSQLWDLGSENQSKWASWLNMY